MKAAPIGDINGLKLHEQLDVSYDTQDNYLAQDVSAIRVPGGLIYHFEAMTETAEYSGNYQSVFVPYTGFDTPLIPPKLFG